MHEFEEFLPPMQVIEEEKLQQNCANIGTYLLKKLATLRDEFSIVGDVRGKGLMIGIEMVTDQVIAIENSPSYANIVLRYTKVLPYPLLRSKFLIN